MTRVLSELLQAAEPHFRLQLRQLEQAGGHQNTDIKLSVDVLQAARQKVKRLGLDQNDTTTEELYEALMQRVSADDARLERALRTRAATYVSAEADLMAGMQHALQAEAESHQAFAPKPVILKRLIKKQPPRHVVKQLKYRSFDAMLRHENPVEIVAAALILESPAWQKSWFSGYKSLNPRDFEERAPQVLCPSSDKWQAITTQIVQEQAHTVIGLTELGAVVLLPLPKERPSGMVIASMALALHELNGIAAASNYLKAVQLQPNFGTDIQAVASGHVQLNAPVIEQSVPWHVIQQYFARTKQAINDDIFGPYVQAADFHWHDVEKQLAKISPSMEFWQDSAYLSWLHQGKIVSLNLLDAAVNCCNNLSYDARKIEYAQQNLWNELVLRYLNHDHLQQAVANKLQVAPLELAEETVQT